jgi:hypothetical protein
MPEIDALQHVAGSRIGICGDYLRTGTNVVFVHRTHFIGIGFGGQPAPHILVQGYTTATNFGAHTTIEEYYFTLLQAFDQATHESDIGSGNTAEVYQRSGE